MRQFLTLAQRMFRLTLSDSIAFFVALPVMPLLGILQGAAAQKFEVIGDPVIINHATGAVNQSRAAASDR